MNDLQRYSPGCSRVLIDPPQHAYNIEVERAGMVEDEYGSWLSFRDVCELISLLVLQRDSTTDELNRASVCAYVLAHAYATDNRPPAWAVELGLEYKGRCEESEGAG